MSNKIRPDLPINLTEVLNAPTNTTNTSDVSFWKMLLYFIIFFSLINLLQFCTDKYKKKQIQNNILNLRVGDSVMVNSTIQGVINKINVHSIYLMIDGTLVPVKKDVIINIKVLTN